MILVDAHVHIYECFDLKKFFSSAFLNFKSVAEKLGSGNDFAGVLLLTETARDNCFHLLHKCADGEHLPHSAEVGKWKFFHTDENCSLYAQHEDSARLVLISGRQIATAENLEVLAAGTRTVFSDGHSINDLISEIVNSNALAVIPWGAGKWLGRRKKVLLDLIESVDNTSFCLGDNSGRPGFWKEPEIFTIARERSIPILRGSDPLPFGSEQGKAGMFGFSIDVDMDMNKPAGTVINTLIERKAAVSPFGKLEGLPGFAVNLIRMQLRKRMVK